MPLDPRSIRSLTQAAKQYNVDPGLLRAVATQESGGDPQVISPAGAEGLMQLMPDTAKELGVDPFDPVQAIHGGARYLAQGLTKGEQLKAQGQDVDPAQYALMYYHGGPNTEVVGASNPRLCRPCREPLHAARRQLRRTGAADDDGAAGDAAAGPVLPADLARLRGAAGPVSGSFTPSPPPLQLASAGVSDIGPGAPAAPANPDGLARLAAAGGSPPGAAGPVPSPVPKTPRHRLLPHQRLRSARR